MNKPILEKLNSFAAKQYGVEFIGEKGDLILPNVIGMITRGVIAVATAVTIAVAMGEAYIEIMDAVAKGDMKAESIISAEEKERIK